MHSDLAAQVREDQWFTGLDDEGQHVEFWPVVEFGEPRCAIGLLASGQWGWGDLGAEGYLVHPLRPPAVVGVLPVLELPLGAVIEMARQSARVAGVDERSLEQVFPSHIVVQVALATRSDYWADLALRWIAGMPTSSLPSDEIEASMDDRRLSQRMRHELRRVHRTLAGSHGSGRGSEGECGA